MKIAALFLLVVLTIQSNNSTTSNDTQIIQLYGIHLPTYINISEPLPANTWDYNTNSSLGDHFQWLYASYNSSSNSTGVDIFMMDHSSQDHYNYTSFEVPGLFYLLVHSPMCVVLQGSSGNGSAIKMYRYDSFNSAYSEENQDFSTLLNTSSAN